MTNDFNFMANEALIRTIAGADVQTAEMSLRTLSNMSVKELTAIKGIGEKTAKKLLAAFELGRRLVEEKTDREDIESSLAIYNRLLPKLSNLEHEECYLLVMNQAFKELACERISMGSATETSMDVREILRIALINRGTIIAVAHNHPSGSPIPSKNDDNITHLISKACEHMRIYFMDHVIFGNRCYYSYHDRNRL